MEPEFNINRLQKNALLLLYYYLAKCKKGPLLPITINNRKDIATKDGISPEAFKKAHNNFPKIPLVITSEKHKLRDAFIKHYEIVLPLLKLQDEQVYEEALKDFSNLKK